MRAGGRRAGRAGWSSSTAPAGAAAGEAPLLRLDATRARTSSAGRRSWDLEAALDATVAWYGAYRAGADMRAETLAQIAAYRGG